MDFVQTELALAKAFGTAAVDPPSWLAALQLLADVTGSRHGQLIGIGGADFVPFNWVTDLPAHATDRFVEIRGGDPTINFRVAAHERGPIVGEDDYDAVTPSLASNIYLDFCSDYDIPFGVQTDLRSGPDGLIGLALLRSKNGRTGADERELFRRTIPHAAHAVRAQLALDGQAAQLAAGMLEALNRPYLLLDARGQVRAVTEAAEQLMARTRAFRIVAGEVVASRDRDRAAIARVLATALAEREDHSTCRRVVIRGADHEDAILLDFVTLPISQWSLRFRPRVVVTLRSARGAAIDAELFRDLFGLTDAEAQIAAALAAGRPRTAIAAERGAALATVASQIKAIFVKTHTAREGELIALLRNLIG